MNHPVDKLSQLQHRPLGAPVGVSVQQAHIAWGHDVLFDGLNLNMEAGQWTCLLGPSGIGKSMLLRLILGLEGTSRERDSVSCSDGLPLAGRATFMAQRDCLFPWLSVVENVCLGHRLRDGARLSSADKDRAMSLLDAVGLADEADAAPNTLSGGMRQRTALARTLMENRPVVLMDEPFSALDAITRIKLQDLAARLLAERTVLLVTHDPLEALRLGHHVHVMKGRPATLGAALQPAGQSPRPVADLAILEMQGDLLNQLAEAAQ